MSNSATDTAREYIAWRQDAFIEELREFCRQPSVGLEEYGMAECVDLVRSVMERRGISTRTLPTGGHPIVYGEIKGVSEKTLLMYGHYDVLPAGPGEQWESPPFAANILGDRIIARGAADHKSSFLARVHAVETLLQQGPLPVTVKFLMEGDEEIGSPGLWEVVTSNRDLLRADACLYSGGAKNADGRPVINAGCRGSLVVELVAHGPNRALHARHAPLAPNPLWRLNGALATLMDAKGDLLIEGFYDDVQAPSEADLEALRRIPFDGPRLRADWGVQTFVGGVDGFDALVRNMFRPACTLCGLTTDGPSTERIPSVARAVLSFSLVPAQTPEETLAKLKSHLEVTGYRDVEISVRHIIGRPARVRLDEKIVKVVMEAARVAYGKEPVLMPMTSSSGPRYIFLDGLGAPMIPDGGVRYAGSNDHGPNENIRLSDYPEGVLHVVEIMRRF